MKKFAPIIVLFIGGLLLFVLQPAHTPQDTSIAAEEIDTTELVEEQPAADIEITEDTEKEVVTEVAPEPTSEDITNLQEKLDLIESTLAGMQEQLEETSVPIVEDPPETVALSYEERAEERIHILTNAERANAGLSVLVTDNELASVAEGHSQDMASRDFFSHDDPDGCNVTCRIGKVGYTAWVWGENIAWRQATFLPDAETLAEAFVQNWMDSPGHRANILKEEYTHHGVGVIRVGDQVYATANFSKPR